MSRPNRRDPTLRRLVAVAALAAAAAIAAPARADDSAAAEALFQQAKTLSDQKRWSEACPKFLASYRLDKTLGTLMNLADCEEHTNHIATAWAHWGEAVELARKTDDKRAKFAGERRDALTPRLPMIQLDIPESRSALEVYRDGVKIDAAAYNVPLPSDPGSHKITVRRGGEVLADQAVVATEGKTVNVAIDLAAIERAHPPAAPQGPAGPQRPIGWATFGVGAAAIVVAGGLEVAAMVNKSKTKATDACVGDYCAPAGIDAANRARDFANAGQWVGIAGLVVTAVGLTLVLTAPKAGPRPAAAALTLGGAVGPAGGGLTLRGAF